MPAAQNRGFISSTSHTIQEYWASPLSKGGTVDSNGYTYTVKNTHIILFVLSSVGNSILAVLKAYRTVYTAYSFVKGYRLVWLWDSI